MYDGAARLTLADQQVRFVAEPDRAKHGIVAATLALPDGPARSELVAGVRLDVVPLEDAP